MKLKKYQDNSLDNMNKIIENFKFIGQKYKSEIHKQEILEDCNEFFLAKIRYVNDKDSIQDESKDTYLRSLTKITMAEIKYDKDLKFFSKEEIEDIFRGCDDISQSTKDSLGSFCNGYLKYCVKNGEIKVNPFEGIKVRKIAGNLGYYKSKIYGMKMFYDICYRMILKTNVNNIKPLLLARYGVAGIQSNSIRTLKYNDINIENMVINTINEDDGLSQKLPIDVKFIDLLAKLSSKDGKELGIDILKSDKYILNMDSVIKYNTMLNRINMACEAIKIPRLAPGDLLFTRRIEMLLIKRKKRKLNRADLKDVLTQFNDGNTKITPALIVGLKNGYELLTGDSVNAENDKSSLIDINANEFAEQKANELGLCISEPLGNDDIHNYQFERREKKAPIIINGKETYPRDSSISALALKLRNYECSASKDHTTFISQTTFKNYVEAHHIIPIKYYCEVNADIDNEANIAALCPNCHRLLHYGCFEEKKHLLEKLYDEHIENLKLADLEVTKIQLLDMYKSY